MSEQWAEYLASFLLLVLFVKYILIPTFKLLLHLFILLGSIAPFVLFIVLGLGLSEFLHDEDTPKKQ